MLVASLLLGVGWAAWHLPTFFMPFTGQASLPVGWLLLEITAASVLYAWLVGNARWSVLLAIAFHASNNALTPILYPAISDAGYLSTYGMVSALVFVAAATVLAIMLDPETMTRVTGWFGQPDGDAAVDSK